MSDKKKKPLTKEELAEIFGIVKEVYGKGGKKITSAMLFDEENPDGEVIFDEITDADITRKKEDLN